MKTLEDLKFKLINGGWGEMLKKSYPRPFAIDWLAITHPEILEEYKEWFDKEVRGK